MLIAAERLFIGGWRHAVLGAEIAGEGVGIGKTTGLADQLNSNIGLVVHHADGIVKTQLTDIRWQGYAIATLRKGGTNALLRKTSMLDERLSTEVGFQEQLFVLYQVAQAEEQLFIGELGEVGDAESGRFRVESGEWRVCFRHRSSIPFRGGSKLYILSSTLYLIP